MERICVLCVNGLLYSLIAVMLAAHAKSDFLWIRDVIRMRRRLRRRPAEEKKKTRLSKHFEMVSEVVLEGKVSGSRLLALPFCIFVPVFLVGLEQLSGAAALILAAVMALLPVGVLELKLSGIRSKGSREGENFISCFLAQYRLAGFNVFEGMTGTITEKNNSRVCCQQLYRVLLELRATGDPGKIRRSTEKFSEAIGTNWGKIFAYNLYIAAAYGINISLALEEILMQLRDARALEEERKRMNGEAVRIVVFLIPVVYAATLMLNIFYLDMSYADYVRNQFGTGTGLALTAAVVILFAVNLAALELVENHRFDY